MQNCCFTHFCIIFLKFMYQNAKKLFKMILIYDILILY